MLVEDDGSVAVTTSQEKWDRMKAICSHWLSILQSGEVDLEYKKLLSDRGFMVYAVQPFPCMMPYLKGFHLSLETWRGGRDEEGWKLGAKATAVGIEVEDECAPTQVEGLSEMASAVWHHALENRESGEEEMLRAPESGVTQAVPRFRSDLEALLELTSAASPTIRKVRSGRVCVAIYGFGDASGSGFGATIDLPDVGLVGRFGVWGKDAEDASSNYRELRNLVETVEKEATSGALDGNELWIFTDNSTAESCFVRGGSSSKKLHALVLRLRLVEMRGRFTLHIVHVAGTRMIAQGTDGLSRGSFLEGVVVGESMLAYIDLAHSAKQRHPPVVEFIKSCVKPLNKEAKVLGVEEWFVEGHGIIGGEKDAHGIWIPKHARNGMVYIWCPPPVLADVALEECLKAVHKRSDAFHIFLIPRLFTPRWSRLFHKLSDFVCHLPAGSPHWPCEMHEPLFVGISLPLTHRPPWSLRRTPLLVGLEREMRRVQSTREADGRDILCKLLRTPGRLAAVSEDVARRMLQMPG